MSEKALPDDLEVRLPCHGNLAEGAGDAQYFLEGKVKRPDTGAAGADKGAVNIEEY